LPIFNHGRLSGNVKVAKARERIALANYERTVQNAFREVADALAGRLHLNEQLQAQQQNRDSQRQIAELARARYEEGTVRYIEVLDAERNLFAAEQAVIQLRRAEMENQIALYVALGGGLKR
jgi:multidrug efflux system outer membrane protein